MLFPLQTVDSVVWVLGTNEWILLFIPEGNIVCKVSSWGLRWEVEPIPADLGQEAGYILDRSPAYHRDNIQRQTTINAHIHTYSQFKVSNPDLQIFGLGEEAGAPRQKSCKSGFMIQQVQNNDLSTLTSD